MFFLVIHQAEGAYRSGLHPEIFFQPPSRSKTELALGQVLLQQLHVKVAILFKNDQVMPVAFVVAEKEILAVGRVDILPVDLRLFYGGGGLVFEYLVPDPELPKHGIDPFFSLGWHAVKVNNLFSLP